MLLEELLGISNKRLRLIFNGENIDREISSSESEDEKPPVDVISLDDISDDDDIEFMDVDETNSSKGNLKVLQIHQVAIQLIIYTFIFRLLINCRLYPRSRLCKFTYFY